MADFNFGFVGNIAEVARHADSNISTGPVASPQFSFLNNDFFDWVSNQDRINTVYASDTDFIWGQKWGNSNSKVSQ